MGFEEPFIRQEELRGPQRAGDAEPGRRLRDDGPSDARRQVEDERRRGSKAPHVDEAALHSGDRLHEPLDVLLACDGTLTRGRAGEGRGHAPEADGVTDGHERLAIRQVHVHRPGRTRPPIGLVTERHPRTHRVRTLRRERRVREPPHVPSEQIDLVDRLVRSDPSELGRTIGSQEDQRDPRHRGFDHRGEEVGGGGPARARDDRRGGSMLWQGRGRRRRSRARPDGRAHVSGRCARGRARSASNATRARCRHP